MRLFPTWLVRGVGYCVAFMIFAFTAWLLTQILLAAPVVFYSVFAALLLAAMVMPLVNWAHRVGVPRWLGALLGVLLVLVAVFGTLTLVVRRAVAQVSDLQNAVDKALAQAQDTLTKPPLSLPAQRVDNLRERILELVSSVLPSPGTGATIVAEVLSGTAIVVFLLFFLLKDGRQMGRWAMRWSTPRNRGLLEDLGSRAWETMSGYALGMVVVALVDSVFIGIGLFVLGVPLAFSLMLLVFLGAFIPIVGATISGALAVGVTAATVGLWQAAVVVGVVLLVQQLEGNLVQPLVMGRAVDLHPVVIVLAVAVGAVVGGIGGAVVSVPLVAVGYRVADRLVGPSSPTSAGTAEDGDATGESDSGDGGAGEKNDADGGSDGAHRENGRARHDAGSRA